MSLPVVVYVLTALAAVVVVLTRVRMTRERAAGRAQVSRGLVNLHTVSGVLGLVCWTAFLLAPEDSLLGGAAVGILGLGLLWVTVVAGLLLLVRWLPTRGRHAGTGGQDEWSEGPGLSVLAHVGLLVGGLVFTVAYLVGAV